MQKFDKVLPRYGDIPADVTDAAVEEMTEIYLSKDQKRDVGLRNIFPPIHTCCNKELEIRSTANCIVFERCKGALQGQLFEGKCNTCMKVYTANTVKNGKSETYYQEILELEYFVSSRETIFSTEFLNSVDRDM